MSKKPVATPFKITKTITKPETRKKSNVNRKEARIAQQTEKCRPVTKKDIRYIYECTSQVNELKLWKWNSDNISVRESAIRKVLFSSKPWIGVANLETYQTLEADWNHEDRQKAPKAQRHCASIKSRWIKKLYAAGHLTKMR